MQPEETTDSKQADPDAMTEMLRLGGELASLQPKKDILDLNEAASWIDCNPNTLKRDAKAGRFPFFMIGNQMRFHVPTVLDFVHRRFHKNK